MNIVLKNKINQNGDLCISVTDHLYPQNDDKIRLPTKTLKMRRFCKINNIGTRLVKENKVPVKYRDMINLNMNYIRRELVENNLTIVGEKSLIVYQHDHEHVKRERKSCKIFDCFK